MSRVPERVVAEVVKEASIKMSDPSYAQTQVGTWVQSQPAATKYMTAYVKELGGAEQVVNMVFTPRSWPPASPATPAGARAR